MKELITIASSFVIVVGLALFMFISNQSHTISLKKNVDVQQLYEEQKKEIERLNIELQDIKLHSQMIDSMFHKKEIR